MDCKGLKGEAYDKCMLKYEKESKKSFKGFDKAKDTVVSKTIKNKDFKGVAQEWSSNSGNGSTKASVAKVYGSKDYKSSYLFKKKNKETNNYVLKGKR